MQGDTGAAGKNTLVSVTAEPAGSHCATGGEKILTGVDTSGNGVLDASEVTSTRYVCNGPTGSATLVSTTTVAPGSQCAAGGTAINRGVDTNGNGKLDPNEITSTTYVCNGASAPDGGKTGTPDAAAPDAAEAGTPDAAEAAAPDAAEAAAPDAAEAGSECSGEAGCPSGLSCAGSYCTATCQQPTDCPTGYYCNTPSSSCLKMGCSTDADCTNPALPKCDPQMFYCTVADTPVAPTIAYFRASPPATVLNAATPVTWVWELGVPGNPPATCSIDHGVGAVTGTMVVPVTQTSLIPTTYTLTCTSSAGSAHKSVILPALDGTPVSVTVTPQGGSVGFGLAGLSIPQGAVAQTTTITGALSNAFLPSPDLVALPVTFYPDGFHFLKPVNITLPPLVATAMSAGGWNVALSDLHVATTSAGAWKVNVLSTVDASSGVLSADIGHFSSAGASASSQGSCGSTPISLATKTIVGRDEIARFGSIGVTDGSGRGIVYDDLKQTSRWVMAHITDTLGTNTTNPDFAGAATGDVNGDGRDEIAVATTFQSGRKGVVQVEILNSCHDSDDPGNCSNDFTVMKYWSVSDQNYTRASIAMGDIDGDGLAEIVLVAEYSGGGELWIWDDAKNNSQLLQNVGGTTSPSSAPGFFNGIVDLQVAVGDVNPHLLT